MQAEEILQKHFHFPSFRPLQSEIVNSILQGKDTLALLPTGGGKSICYQVPGMVFFEEGYLTLVISPLIALMKDQVDHLLQKGIQATFINHTLTDQETTLRLQEISQKKYTFIYISPERLTISSFVELCQHLPIKLVAIDEAHCISQWGHDFRPEYLQIAQFINKLQVRPIVAAFTATAPPAVKKEIASSLCLQKPNIFQESFFRGNLVFRVIHCQNSRQQELHLLHLAKSFQDKPGIIYCSTRKKTEVVAQFLKYFQIPCLAYHGGMSAEQRTLVQESFLQNKVKLISATNAFGMGVDKPDIATVIHFNFPSNLEAYYQEAGRAGRDGKQAKCYLLFQEQDIEPILSLLPKKALQRKIAKKKLLSMIRYLTIQSCRTQFLLQYLGEKKTQKKCQNCDNCLKQKIPKKNSAHLNRYLKKWQKKKGLFPSMTAQLIEYLQLARPQTKQEFLQLPGIGLGWLQKYYHVATIDLLGNVLQN